MPPFPDSLPDQMVHMLNTSLRIPRANRTVSDFLFRSLLDSPFHPSHPLPPASLATSLSIHLTHSIDPIPNPLYPPASRHKPVPQQVLAEQPPSTGIQISTNHAIFIPVATFTPYTLGYALFHDPNHETICLRANPFAPPYAARFVFDNTTDDLLLVTHAGSPPSIGLRAFVNSKSPCREQYLIAVPPVCYEWPHLPTTPLWMVSNIEFRTPNFDFSEPSQSDLPPVLSRQSALQLLDAALDPDPVPSHNETLPTPASSMQPWPQSSSGQFADGLEPSILGPPTNMNSTSSTSFRNDLLVPAISRLQSAIAGTFYSPSMRLDFAPGTSSFTGRAALEMQIAPPRLASELCEQFAALYYLNVLSVSPDAPLLRPAAERGVPALPGCAGCRHRAANIKRVAIEPGWRADGVEPGREEDEFLMGLLEDRNDVLFTESINGVSEIRSDAVTVKARSCPSRNKNRALRPRPSDEEDTEIGKKKCLSVTQVSEKVGSASAKEKMLAARKMRNRLSAARSNEKRKARVAALENDVAAGRERVKVLSERLDVVAEENARLRRELDIVDS